MLPQLSSGVAPRRGHRWSDAAFVLMMTVGWIAGNVLALFGCVVAALVLVSDGDFAAFMAQLDNLAGRYLAADALRRSTFEHEVLLALLTCGAVLFLVRLPRFVMRVRIELQREAADVA